MNTRRILYIGSAIISLITLAVYLPALRNGFLIWDDRHLIVDNIHIRAMGWSFFSWAFSTVSLAVYWHPVTWASHALDYAVWGLDPLGHHLTNTVLHAVNTFVVILLVIQLLETGRKTTENHGPATSLTDRRILITAAATGMLFGLHPLHVESVAWVSERKELLYALFFLLSMMAYLTYALGRGTGADHARSGRLSWLKPYLLSLALFALSLASKPMAVTLPAVLLILDWYPVRRLGSLKDIVPLFIEKVPFFALSLGITIITIMPQKVEGTIPTLDWVPFSMRMLVASKALVSYLWKTVLPLDLSPLYPYPRTAELLSIEYFPSVALVIGVSIICLLAAKKQKIWPALWGSFIVMLLPVLGIIQVGHHSMADRFTYVPGIGPLILLGAAVAWAWEKAESLKRGVSYVKGLALVVCVLLCAALASVTIRQIGVWKDTVTLWSAVIEQAPDRVPLAYLNRGMAFAELKQNDRALDDFNAVIRLNPRSSPAYNNRGRIYQEQGRTDSAFEDYATAIELDRGNTLAYNNRGLAFKAIGHSDRAIEDFTAAIAADPGYAAAYSNRGIVYGETGQLDKAIEDFTSSMKANPYYTDAYTGRGLAFAGKGLFDRAIEDYTIAIEQQPADHLAYNNRGIAFGKKGQFARAIEDLTRAIELKPDLAEAYLERGRLYLRSGKATLAEGDYRKACELGDRSGCAALRALQE